MFVATPKNVGHCQEPAVTEACSELAAATINIQRICHPGERKQPEWNECVEPVRTYGVKIFQVVGIKKLSRTTPQKQLKS
jgi:hypothetical protein